MQLTHNQEITSSSLVRPTYKILNKILNKMALWRELIETCNKVEAEIRNNEKFLQMRIDGYEEFNIKLCSLLKRTDVSDSEKILILKGYMNIK